MLKIPKGTKVFVCLEATDMRRSFDKLSYMVKEYLDQDPFSGHMFIFRNRNADKLKILYYDGKGLCLWYKKLPRGSFILPTGIKSNFEMTKDKLSSLLEGLIPLGKRGKKKWYE